MGTKLLSLQEVERTTGTEKTYSLDAKHLMYSFFRTSPAFWLLCLYVFFEYVRPQQVYTWMDVAPWPLISLLMATLAALVGGRLRFRSKGLWLPLALFSIIVIASSAAALNPQLSFSRMDVWVNWLIMIVLVGAGVRSKREFFLFLVLFGLWNVKMTQFGVRAWLSSGFSFRATGVSGGPGWFQNSGEFGIEMCVFLPLAVYFSIGLWPKTSRVQKALLVAVCSSALISMVVTSSRGALVGAAAVGLWFLLKSQHRAKALAAILVVGVCLWAVVPSESKARFSEIGSDKSSVSRLTYWKHAIQITNDHPILGIGYENWIPYYRTYFNPRGELPHNFLLQCSSELGYLGLGALVFVLIAYFVETHRIRKRCAPDGPNPDRFLWAMAHGLDGAMVGFVVSGSFVTVLFYPYLWMNVALVISLASITAVSRTVHFRRRSSP